MESPSQGVNRNGMRSGNDMDGEMRILAQQNREREMAAQRQILLQQQQQQEEYLLRQQEQELRLREREQQQQHYLQEQERRRFLLQQEQMRQQELQQRDLRHDLMRQRERELLQQQQYQQQTRTPPPRMLASPSPRFLEHQRQMQIIQYQQERQQALRVQELQEQVRMENLERQMRAQQIGGHQRQLSNHTMAELQAAQAQLDRRQRSQSPAARLPLGEGLHYVPQQPRTLADITQSDMLRDLGGTPAEQETLRMEAMRKIVEAEKLEEKRRRRAAKIAHMVNSFSLPGTLD